jgi:hypothetical protein
MTDRERIVGVGKVGICGLVGELIAPGLADFLLMGDSTEKREATYNISLGGGRSRMCFWDKKYPKPRTT